MSALAWLWLVAAALAVVWLVLRLYLWWTRRQDLAALEAWDSLPGRHDDDENTITWSAW